ncbi:LysR family transcriptional regulator [Paeniglutamicibacter terrestris]|jgi:DNA-binding transcriptional LysR family regulator|uniref:LysR family transcriptional regulator n=1 Tax=Paeniglutamicibacter terrestris TaxID=2723403 RepID=A0ABX1G110_9MICC|nr:LysR family transcriptional regulator [Paeniglutamicibacter terrestris]NKG19688.1 LysR family transcriptional regulator [Paeniglutamicibacter terrestris]
MNLDSHPRLTLRQLWHFVVAAEAGTMAEAARRLHMAPSAISMSIAELERIVGSDLAIKRRAKGLTLTATGRTVLGQARVLLELAGELETLGQGTRASLRGPLTVGCFMSLGPTIIPTMLRAFAEQCPEVEVDFVEGYHADLQQALLDGSIDAAFLYGAEISPSLSSAPVTDSELYVLISNEHALKDADSVSLADIAEEPLVLFDADPISRRILGLFEEAGMTPTVRHRSRSYATVRSLVGSGRGVALLFQQPELEAPYQELRVVLKRLDAPGMPGAAPVPVSVVWPRSTRLNARAQAWVEVASELFAHATPPV